MNLKLPRFETQSQRDCATKPNRQDFACHARECTGKTKRRLALKHSSDSSVDFFKEFGKSEVPVESFPSCPEESFPTPVTLPKSIAAWARFSYKRTREIPAPKSISALHPGGAGLFVCHGDPPDPGQRC